jgi:hypothetical protein
MAGNDRNRGIALFRRAAELGHVKAEQMVEEERAAA